MHTGDCVVSCQVVTELTLSPVHSLCSSSLVSTRPNTILNYVHQLVLATNILFTAGQVAYSRFIEV